jgi:NAD-dependent dihydropyrimidine dehydrogenase PreA subunit
MQILECNLEINKEVCIGCGICLPICPVGAIFLNADEVAEIDLKKCVECSVCFRSSNCPVEAFSKDELVFPRQIRRWFSDNTEKIPSHQTLGSGRGVDEVKTNDKTGYYKKGEVGFIVEPGRPGISAGMDDVQKVLHGLYAAGYKLTERSPLKFFVENNETGDLNPAILGERVLSCSIEFKGLYSDIPHMAAALANASKTVNTVLCVGVISRVENWEIPPVKILNKLGYQTEPNAKINIGLGRPLAED